MNRGEIWWTDVPGLGRRPVLVMTRDLAIPVLSDIVVALVTATIRGIPTEVVVDESDGLPRRSAISLDNLRTLSKRRLIQRVTMLSQARLDEVCEALRFAMAC